MTAWELAKILIDGPDFEVAFIEAEGLGPFTVARVDVEEGKVVLSCEEAE